LIGVCCTSPLYANTYKYVDRSGTVVMTDKYDSIPKQYRGRVTVVKDAPAVRQAPVPSAGETQSGQEQAPSSPETGSAPAWREKYLLPAGLLAGLIAGFFLIRRICAGIGRPRVGAIVFLCFALAVGVFVYRLYMEQMAETFNKLKADAFNIKKNVETRGEKTNNSIRESERR
jgi:uncharacterized protein YneF (UPF0154 family)